VADPELISDQLRALHRRLPGPLYDEVADGLLETYEAKLRLHADAAVAARAAVTEFGDVDTITRAVCLASPWHRLSRVLLLTGPALGGLWAVTLLSQPTWLWSLPAAVRLGYGAALLGAVTLLVSGRVETRAYARGRRRVLLASLVLVVLDLTMCSALLGSVGPGGPAAFAALTGSLLRAAAVGTAALRHVTSRRP
jgi:hypothetical protein